MILRGPFQFGVRGFFSGKGGEKKTQSTGFKGKER
jgi:hypothetical protein